MDEPKDSYTVMIFRGSMAGPLKFSFSRSVVRKAVIVGVVLAIVQVVLLSQAVLRIGEMWELKALRAEMASVREQTTSFSNTASELRRRLMAMKEVNQRLRLMLGIEAPKTETITDGKGGDPEPPAEPKDVSGLLNPPSEDQPIAKADGEEASDGQNSVALSQVQETLTWLQREAGTEEQSLHDLESVVQNKQARWDATPSIWPVKGWVTSGFGKRVSPFTGQVMMHEGLDIGAPFNTPVVAPAAGRVVTTGFDPRMGNVISVDHGFGIETQYGHLAKILVKNGQKVKRGDIIALVGSTGLSTGPHLHYLVKSNNHAVDPQRYILD